MDKKRLVEVLLELRAASMRLGSNPSEDAIKSLMHKYNMLFLGENLNEILSLELCHTLKNYFHIETNNDELNNLLPDVCKTLNMKFEPMIKVNKLSKTTTPDCYQITLW